MARFRLRLVTRARCTRLYCYLNSCVKSSRVLCRRCLPLTGDCISRRCVRAVCDTNRCASSSKTIAWLSVYGKQGYRLATCATTRPCEDGCVSRRDTTRPIRFRRRMLRTGGHFHVQRIPTCRDTRRDVRLASTALRRQPAVTALPGTPLWLKQLCVWNAHQSRTATTLPLGLVLWPRPTRSETGTRQPAGCRVVLHLSDAWHRATDVQTPYRRRTSRESVRAQPEGTGVPASAHTAAHHGGSSARA